MSSEKQGSDCRGPRLWSLPMSLNTQSFWLLTAHGKEDMFPLRDVTDRAPWGEEETPETYVWLSEHSYHWYCSSQGGFVLYFI